MHYQQCSFQENVMYLVRALLLGKNCGQQQIILVLQFYIKVKYGHWGAKVVF